MEQNKGFQEKTKNQKDKFLLKKGIRVFCFSIFILGAMFIVVAPLLHIYCSKDNPIVQNYKLQLNEEIIQIEQEINALRLDYDNNKISAETYIHENDELFNLLKEITNKNDELIKLKIDENRYFGWVTFRKFMVGFGIRLPYLLFSIIISFLISKINTVSIFLKRCFFVIQTICYSSSFYVLIWCFWYSQDYPIETYRFTIVVGCVLVAIASVNFIIYKELFLLKLQKALNAFSRFALIDVKKHINPDKIPDYRKDLYQTLKDGMKK